MSKFGQAQKEYDYEVNLKAKLVIMLFSNEVDELHEGVGRSVGDQEGTTGLGSEAGAVKDGPGRRLN